MEVVKRNYKRLMAKLHPDKISQTDSAGDALHQITQAKSICEKALSTVSIRQPSRPENVLVQICDLTPGRRRYVVSWNPTRWYEPHVLKYMVKIRDPACPAFPFQIGVLEADYNETLGRYATIDELTSFVVEEKNLAGLVSVWQQSNATMYIHAQNEAGTSMSEVQIPLSASEVRIPLLHSSEPSFTVHEV
jgi:hypothetical protein